MEQNMFITYKQHCYVIFYNIRDILQKFYTHVLMFCKDPCGTVVCNKTLSTATVILFNRPNFRLAVMSL